MSYMKKVLVRCELLVRQYVERQNGFLSSWVGNPELTQAKQSSAKELQGGLTKLRTQSTITYMDTGTGHSKTVTLDSDENIYEAAKNILASETLKVSALKKEHKWGKDGDYDKILTIIHNILIKSFGIMQTSQLINLTETQLNEDPRAIFVGALAEYIIALELDQLADQSGVSKTFGTDYKIGTSYWALSDLTNQLSDLTRQTIIKANKNYEDLGGTSNILSKINCIKPLIKAFQLEEKDCRNRESKSSYGKYFGGHKDGRLTTLVNEALEKIEGLVYNRQGREQLMALLHEQQRKEQTLAEKEKWGQPIYSQFCFGDSAQLGEGQRTSSRPLSFEVGNPFDPNNYLSSLNDSVSRSTEESSEESLKEQELTSNTTGIENFEFITHGSHTNLTPLFHPTMSQKKVVPDLAQKLSELVSQSESNSISEVKKSKPSTLLMSAPQNSPNTFEIKPLDKEEGFQEEDTSKSKEEEPEDKKERLGSF